MTTFYLQRRINIYVFLPVKKLNLWCEPMWADVNRREPMWADMKRRDPTWTDENRREPMVTDEKKIPILTS